MNRHQGEEYSVIYTLSLTLSRIHFKALKTAILDFLKQESKEWQWTCLEVYHHCLIFEFGGVHPLDQHNDKNEEALILHWNENNSYFPFTIHIYITSWCGINQALERKT